MALSKADLNRIINAVPEPDNDDIGKWVVGVIRSIEAEVRKQDTALIRQMLDALSDFDYDKRILAIAAANARLEQT